MRYQIVLAAALAGCAMSPSDLREQGERAEFKSAKAPRDVANCIAYNGSELKLGGGLAGPFPSSVRDGKRPGTLEVLLQRSDGGYALVAEIEPSPDGSRITTWMTPHLIYRSMPQQVMKGCE